MFWNVFPLIEFYAGMFWKDSEIWNFTEFHSAMFWNDLDLFRTFWNYSKCSEIILYDLECWSLANK